MVVLCGSERRRRRTTAEKLRIVDESLVPAASIVEVARRHDVHPNLLTVWRRQARRGAFVSGAEPPARPDDEVRFAAVFVAALTDGRSRRSRCRPTCGCGGLLWKCFNNDFNRRQTNSATKAREVKAWFLFYGPEDHFGVAYFAARRFASCHPVWARLADDGASVIIYFCI